MKKYIYLFLLICFCSNDIFAQINKPQTFAFRNKNEVQKVMLVFDENGK